MTDSLRDRLIGAWELIDVVATPEDGSGPQHLFGDRPAGFILYTPDGYMSAQIMRRDKPQDERPWTALSDEERGRHAGAYLAYSGPYHVDEDTGALTHTMAVSLFPAWLGQTQPRAVRLSGDELELSAVAEAADGQGRVTTRITWRRAAGTDTR